MNSLLNIVVSFYLYGDNSAMWHTNVQSILFTVEKTDSVALYVLLLLSAHGHFYNSRGSMLQLQDIYCNILNIIRATS